MKRLSLLGSVYLLLFSLQLQAQNLDQFLGIDRFCYYATDLAGSLRGKSHTALSNALEEITPEEVWAYVKNSPELTNKLNDSHQYDELLRIMVSERHPELASQKDLILSNYNFFKNKINESYKFKPINDLTSNVKMIKPTTYQSYTIPAGDATKLTLNGEHYISNRQTRAIIWDAINNGRDVEFYLEEFPKALSSIESRGGTIVGEVKTLANNYNKNYLVHYPGENRYAHIITDISGTDRLHHLTKQLSIMKWNGVSAATRLNKTVKVYGPLENVMDHERKRLVDLMEVLPKADHVILGQKGAMERSVRTAQKVEAVLAYTAEHADALNLLDDSEKKLIRELQESQDLFKSMYQASKWDGIHKKLESRLAELPETFAFNLDLNSHSVADVNIRSASGKSRRIRLISNVWGNESKPIADALIQTGHTNYTYIGTVGSLSRDYKVGSVVSPSKVELKSGRYINLESPSFKPPGLIEGGSLAQVASLFDETEKWLSDQHAKGNDLVEMEVSHLAESFEKKSGVKFNVFLLVSDMVGEEGETLDQAGSSVRKKAQLNTLYEIFKAENAARVIPPSTPGAREVDSVISGFEAKRSALSMFQVKQTLKKTYQGEIPSDSIVRAALDQHATFSPAALQKRLELVQDFMNKAYLIAKTNQKDFNVVVDGSLFDGTYHPKKKMKLSFLKNSPLDISFIEKLRDSNTEFVKYIDVEAVTSNLGQVPVSNAEIPRLNFMRIYSDVALTEGGLLGRVSKAGNLAFSALPMKDSCRMYLKAAAP